MRIKSTSVVFLQMLTTENKRQNVLLAQLMNMDPEKPMGTKVDSVLSFTGTDLTKLIITSGFG